MNVRRSERLAPLAGMLLLGLAALPLTPRAQALDVPLPGTHVRLGDSSSSPLGRRSYAALRSTGPEVDIPDPRTTGATAYIGRAGGPATVIAMPPDGWSRPGTNPLVDYEFKSSTGTIISARLIAGRSIRFSAYGPGAYPLDGTQQGGVGVIVDVGGVRLCGFFGGKIQRDNGVKFLAVRAPAPAACPDFGQSTTTTTTTTSTTSTTPPACHGYEDFCDTQADCCAGLVCAIEPDTQSPGSCLTCAQTGATCTQTSDCCAPDDVCVESTPGLFLCLQTG